MSATAHVFPQVQQKIATKSLNLSTDSLKVMLLSAYAFANTHASIADVKGAGTEVVGTGYTAGGVALSSVAMTTTGATSTLTAANPSWAASTLTAAFAVFYDASGGSDAANVPFVYWDFGGNQSTSGSTLTLTVSGSGLWVVTHS